MRLQKWQPDRVIQQLQDLVDPKIDLDANWSFKLRIVTDQFSAETSQAPHIRLCDLVLRVFKEHLHHTPLKALGINRSVHFRVGSFAERDRIGRTLAPVEP